IIYAIPATDRMGNLIPSVTTTVNQTAQGDTHSAQYSFSVGAGYDFNVRGFTVTPFARLEYVRLNIDGYQEAINNAANGFGLALEQVCLLDSAAGWQPVCATRLLSA